MRIEFKKFENGEWKRAHEVIVDPLEPSEVERVARKYLRKNIAIFDTKEKALNARTCFERVTSDGTNTIYLKPDWEIDTKRYTRNRSNQAS